MWNARIVADTTLNPFISKPSTLLLASEVQTSVPISALQWDPHPTAFPTDVPQTGVERATPSTPVKHCTARVGPYHPLRRNLPIPIACHRWSLTILPLFLARSDRAPAFSNTVRQRWRSCHPVRRRSWLPLMVRDRLNHGVRRRSAEICRHLTAARCSECNAVCC